MSEIDDRDLALAEKSLASLRNHRRAGAAAHSDNCRCLVFSEINRSLSNTGRPFLLPLSTTISYQLTLNFLSLSFFLIAVCEIDSKGTSRYFARDRLGHPV